MLIMLTTTSFHIRGISNYLVGKKERRKEGGREERKIDLSQVLKEDSSHRAKDIPLSRIITYSDTGAEVYHNLCIIQRNPAEVWVGATEIQPMLCS